MGRIETRQTYESKNLQDQNRLGNSLDHSKRYKIWEQTYSNDKLNGQWKTYTLRGTQANFQTFRNDSLNGITRNFWIDGKTIIEENEYSNGQIWIEQIYRAGKSWTVVANYTDKGQRRDPGTLRDGNGTLILYNEDGTVRESTTFVNGEERSSR